MFFRFCSIRIQYIFFASVILFLVQCTSSKKEYIYNSGEVFGGYYNIKYESPEGKDFKTEIENRFLQFNKSLSTYDPNSIISRINQNDSTVETDSDFEKMYAFASDISQKTNGVFDITVAPLVNAWGFGYGNQKRNQTPDVDTIMPYIGYKKIKLENHRLLKDDARIKLDANALAPGLASDIIAALLEQKGCTNYLIEIGGEIRCKGVNPEKNKWRVGIDKPVENPENNQQEIQTVLSVSNIGLATSGNYREFYYKDGKKYAHTIDPHSGKPILSNLLSATIIAPTCVQADAYATACMVLGTEKALKFCEDSPELECYLIYSDEDGNFKVIYSKGFEKYLIK